MGLPSIMKKDGVETEQLILLMTNYHSRPPADFAKDAVGGVGMEVRFVRQLLH